MAPKIAICYWGLLRTLREVYPLQKKYVYDELDNAGVSYDIYLHTWHSAENIVWDRRMNKQFDYESIDLLRPLVARQIDSQSVFLDGVNMSKYYRPDEYEWLPFLIKNHLCALESQKRCADLCRESGVEYDYVMFLRPDAQPTKRLPVEQIFNSEFEDNTIIIPNYNHWEGYNDQFAILKFSDFSWYSDRVEGLEEFRKTNGRIVSEKYVKYVVEKNGYTPKQIDFHFDLLRPNGKLNGD
jgi:hypothetical protein